MQLPIHACKHTSHPNLHGNLHPHSNLRIFITLKSAFELLSDADFDALHHIHKS